MSTQPLNFRRAARLKQASERLPWGRLRVNNGPIRGVAQPGSAPALGAGGRQFKSDRPDHNRIEIQAVETRLFGPPNSCLFLKSQGA